MTNILFIVAEELRADALSCYGNTFCETPHLDALAARGVRFDRHYTVHGKCVPSRVAMITGTYPSALGCRELTTYPSQAEQRNIALHLKEHGYRTALIGKNHVLTGDMLSRSFDANPKPGPTFQNYQVDDYDTLPPLGKALYQGRIDAPVEETRDWISVDQLADFLDEDRDAPFFAWLNFENAHPPYAAPEPYFSRVNRDRIPTPRRCDFADKPALMRTLHETWQVDQLSDSELREIKAVYHGQVQIVDDMVGRTMAMLNARGLLENTLVVFTADHGDFAGEFGLVEKWDTAFQDEITRVPLIVAGPGVEGAGRTESAFVENIDILPTALGLLSLPVADCVQHACSFAPVLRNEKHAHRADVYAEGGVEPEGLTELAPLSNEQAYAGKHRALHRAVHTLASARMLRTERWKLVQRREGMNELYDMENDPGETVNRITDPALADVRETLLIRLAERMMQAAPRRPALPATGVMA